MRINFRVIEEVAVGKVFFNRIFGFEGLVKTKGPENVKKQYEEGYNAADFMLRKLR